MSITAIIAEQSAIIAVERETAAVSRSLRFEQLLLERAEARNATETIVQRGRVIRLTRKLVSLTA